jgi:hypothetical protein
MQFAGRGKFGRAVVASEPDHVITGVIPAYEEKGDRDAAISDY